jgi:hypothetical protein
MMADADSRTAYLNTTDGVLNGPPNRTTQALADLLERSGIAFFVDYDSSAARPSFLILEGRRRLLGEEAIADFCAAASSAAPPGD